MLFVAFLAAFSLSARAQTFGPSVAVTADSDVLALGLTALAYDYNGVTAAINGVSFSGSTTQNDIVLTTTGVVFTSQNGVNPATGMSAAFTSVLQDVSGTFAKAGSTPIALTFSNLAPSVSYDLQLFSGVEKSGTGHSTVSDMRASAAVAYGPGTSSANSGVSYVQIFFTTGALQTSQTIDIVADATSTYGLVNAVNLRDLGLASAPEPSTWALFGLGALVLGGFAFRRRAA